MAGTGIAPRLQRAAVEIEMEKAPAPRVTKTARKRRGMSGPKTTKPPSWALAGIRGAARGECGPRRTASEQCILWRCYAHVSPPPNHSPAGR